MTILISSIESGIVCWARNNSMIYLLNFSAISFLILIKSLIICNVLINTKLFLDFKRLLTYIMMKINHDEFFSPRILKSSRTRIKTGWEDLIDIIWLIFFIWFYFRFPSSAIRIITHRAVVVMISYYCKLDPNKTILLMQF